MHYFDHNATEPANDFNDFKYYAKKLCVHIPMRLVITVVVDPFTDAQFLVPDDILSQLPKHYCKFQSWCMQQHILMQGPESNTKVAYILFSLRSPTTMPTFHTRIRFIKMPVHCHNNSNRNGPLKAHGIALFCNRITAIFCRTNEMTSFINSLQAST